MSLSESIRVNTLWVMSGDIAARVTHFAFGILLARLLVPAEFGLLVTVQIVTGALGFLAAGGMSDALIRAAEVSPRDIRTVFTMQLAIGIGIFALLNGVAPHFAWFFDDSRLDSLMRVAAATFLLRPFLGVPSALLQRDMRFKSFSILIFVGLLSGGVASTVMAALGLGAWSLVLGGLVGTAVRTPLTMRAARWYPRLGLDPQAARRLGGFGIRVSIIDLVRYTRAQVANAAVSRQLGLTAVGLYNKADSLAEIPLEMLSGSAYQTVFRALSSIRDDRDRSAYLFLRTVTLVSLYALPLYLGMAWIAEPFIVLLYGQPWAGAALPLQILAGAGLLRILSSLSAAVIAAHNRLGDEIRIQLQSLVLLIAGTLIGLHWGLAGVALGALPSLAYSGALMYRLAGEILAIGWASLWQALRPVLALNGALALALALGHWTLGQVGWDQRPFLYSLAMTAVGAAVYGGLFLLAPPPSLRTESARWRRQIAGVARACGRRP